MVVGVSEGFSKTLELVGTGYRAAVAGQELSLSVGYNKPRVLYIPPGVTVKVRMFVYISGESRRNASILKACFALPSAWRCSCRLITYQGHIWDVLIYLEVIPVHTWCGSVNFPVMFINHTCNDIHAHGCRSRSHLD